MKKLSEFQNANADMVVAIHKLNDLSFNYLLSIDENFETETRGNLNNVISGNKFFHPALFSVVKKSNSVYFVMCQYRGKMGCYYNFELDIDITNDDLNKSKFEKDYYPE